MNRPLAEAPWPSTSGTRITAVRTFLTAPQGSPYLIVRVETDQPGLYGLGCASDPQRTLAVRSVVDDYLGPMLLGRDPADIEDIHRLLLNSGYWRGGSISGNALAGVDVALWDIKAKSAGLPLYSLLGGRVRDGVRAYTHVDGSSVASVVEGVEAAAAKGFGHVRVQVAVPGTDTYGAHGADAELVRSRNGRWDSAAYVAQVPAVLREVRSKVPRSIELLHDSHERLTAAQARQFLRALDGVELFFLEDVLAPEDADYFPQLRASTSIPLAMGELFHDVSQFLPLLRSRSIDFARIRIPTLGGLTPVRKLVAACELFGVRIAPHGPGDVSPLGHAANLAVDVSSLAFGIQEAATLRDATLEVFPGTPVPVSGSLHPSPAPGLGVDFDESAARRFPPPEPGDHDRWALLRSTDATPHRP
ncbi:enolase C-terminal domain-like protein [Amycolatopsis sp.]|uniref:enolase C-terminal domain-like protein n=1 Tax=Amycolatopsis sp. TaxID=37632 RepID=UPI002DF9B378|nr:enolase C-terminal domain-like protein [Amycolatopsis sp.]